VGNQALLFVGIDWGSDAHYVRCCDFADTGVWEGVFCSDAAGLVGLAKKLEELSREGPERTFVAIERPDGPVVATLQQAGFRVHCVSPNRVKKYRELWYPSGVKDDYRDAFILSAILRTMPGCCRFLEPKSEPSNRMGAQVRYHWNLAHHKTQFSNSVRDHLKMYYPQFLEVSKDLGAAWVVALWRAAPNPRAAGELTLADVRSVLSKNRGKVSRAPKVLEILQRAPIATMPGEAECKEQQCAYYFGLLESTVKEQKRVDKELTALSAPKPREVSIPPAVEPVAPSSLSVEKEAVEAAREGAPVDQPSVSQILASMPGAGPLTRSAFLGLVPQALEMGNVEGLRAMCGTAPISLISGKQKSVRMRKYCDHQLRDVVHHWAINAVNRDAFYRAKFHRHKSTGLTTGAALRRVADSLVTTLGALIENGCLYDPAYKLAEMAKTG